MSELTQNTFPVRYNPKSFKYVVGHEKLTKALKKFIENDEFPNLMFIGRAGIGKTMLSKLFIKAIHGENWQGNFMHLNASDDNGIDVIRTKVKQFAKLKSMSSDKPKYIIMDELENLTRNAQEACKYILENFKNTRFILICNDESKIINPLKSRCIVFRLKPLTSDYIFARLLQIKDKYDISIKKNKLTEIAENCDGDMRQALNMLHATLNGIDVPVSVSSLTLLKMKENDFTEAVFKFSPDLIFQKIYQECLSLQSKNKAQIYKILAETDIRLSMQTIKTLQLIDCYYQLKELI